MIARKSLTIVTLVVAVGLAACNEEAVTGPGFVCDVTNPVRDILLSPSSAQILVHSPALSSDTVRLQAVATNRLGSARSDVLVKFSSSDTSIATVDTLGVVSARKPGSARITASACGESSSAQITIVASVARVSVSPASDTVIAGDTAFVVARAFGPDDSQISGARFTFGASNSSVTVIQTSDSTAKFATSAAGSSTLSATSEGTLGTGALLILSRVFLAGTAIANAIDVGDATACGLITLGHGFCWGLNSHGQIGAKTDSTCFAGTDPGTVVNDSLKTTAVPCSLVPLAISHDIDFATISAGDSTGCGISVAGRAYCWGAGIHGEIGNGLTADRAAPVLVTSAIPFTSISVGGGHVCAIATGGFAYCWGSDDNGQLGDARLVNSTTPIPVSGGGGPATFASISAGFRHSCAVAFDGTGYCWGNNDFGQLGNGSTSSSDTPVQVAGSLGFLSISAGGDHSCGILAGGGAVCWGSNVDGQLGKGSVGDTSLVPVAVAGGLSFTRISASTGTRTLDSKGSPFKKLGHGHTCALTAAGAVFCWGDDTDLQLGRGQFTGGNGVSGTPAPVFNGERPASAAFTSISTGSRHSCAVANDGNAYCWGSNVFGGLGNTLQAAFRGFPQRVATPR